MKTLLPLIFALVIHSTSAEVTALNLFLGAGQSWTVPQGHTAIITHTARTGGAIATLRFRVYFPQALNTQYALIAADGTLGQGTNALPMYFGTGTRFENPSANVVPVILIGRLAEAGDLFASVSSEMEVVETSSTALQAKVTPAAKRPAKVTVEESTNLLAWNPSPSAIVERTAQGDYNTTIAKDGDPTKLVRTTVRVRPQ